jgi:predicted ATPase
MELLKGNIVKDESPVKNIYYKPNNLNDNLPLYLTSSLVTEVAPLVLFLSDVNSNFKTLIIEEPEAHLHLKAQIAMARVVVRLINSGLNVWITTHSDTFMQQINNLMKVNVHKNKEEILRQLDLEEEDCLDISKVKIYEFNTNIDKTTVTSIKNSETGFPLPTFNNIINKLMDEVMILEDDEND